MLGSRNRTIADRVRSLLVCASAALLVLGILPLAATPASAAPVAATVASASDTASTGVVNAADLTQFQAGNIISDAAFFASGTMSEAQIQQFLEQKVPRCESGYTCLRDWYDTSRTTSADAMCGAYSGGTRERASTIIYKVAQACGINPQVILVMLQKEQGLVTHVWPSEWRYTIAMGQGCPDTAACDTQYYGFFNQVYGAAWQLKRYANPAGTSQYFTWYAPGKTWNILWNPNTACGSSPVYIQNQATANLYYYTPYQPNAAALRAGYGEGDGCSSYGNRNFYQYFTDWFGSTQAASNVCSPPSGSAVAAADGEYVVNVDALNARQAPTTTCDVDVRSLPRGTIVTRTATYGDWWQVRVDGATYWVFGEYLTPAPAPTYSVDRLAGADRYETAVAVSKQSFPSGGASAVYLAAGTNFPDALSATAAAAVSDAALLLTAPEALPQATKDELVRLAPSSVILVGGESVITASVQNEIALLLPGATIERSAGADRYATSRAIAVERFDSAGTAYIATGWNFADALAASAIAGAKASPVILVDGTAAAATNETVSALRELGVTNIVIAGGTAAVSSGVESSLRNAGFAVQRFGGADRYQTAQLMVDSTYPGTAAQVYLATGADFPDALAGAVLAASIGAPLLPQPGSCMTGASKDYMMSHGTQVATIIGGPSVMNEAIARSVRC